MTKKHNKLKKLVVGALSKYLSKDEVDTFVKNDGIKSRNFKLPNSEKKYWANLIIRYYKDNMEEGCDKSYDLFKIFARTATRMPHFNSFEGNFIKHELSIDSRKIFDPIYSHEKNKSAKKKVEKEIRRFFENQAIIFDDTRSWFDDKRIKNERKKRNLKKKDSKNDRQ
jgi:hypothetical protein